MGFYSISMVYALRLTPLTCLLIVRQELLDDYIFPND
jgi:hypothetical protein